MEFEEVSTSSVEHLFEVEMLKPSKENDSLCKPHSLSKPPQFSCNPICSFSKQEYNLSDFEQRSKSTTKLRWLIVFYAIVMLVEIVGGLKANSLAVLTDAAHLLSDIAGFSISLFAIWASSWEANSRQSFGFNRLEVLGALLSVQLIWLISGFLIYEALVRILHKNAKVNGKLMFAIAAFGFIINLIMVLWLGHNHHHGHGRDGHDNGHSHGTCMDKNHDQEKEELCALDEESTNLVLSPHEKTTTPLNINLQGAYLHVMADLIQTIGVMIAGSIIWAKPDWLVVDLVCTLIFSIFALGTTLPMLRSIFFILMEGTPCEIDVTRIENDLKYIKGVCDVHDLHVWAITVGKLVLACHVRIEPDVDSNIILQDVRDCCERRHRIHHVTIQIEQG
ncbi:hypothetical protein LguiB_031143 [Lonicera macranthoides]